MKKTKKAQGLSLTTVILAALALIVLIVLVLIFTGRIGIFSSGVNDCPAHAQVKVGSPADCGNGVPAAVINNDESPSGKVYCCESAKDGATTYP